MPKRILEHGNAKNWTLKIDMQKLETNLLTDTKFWGKMNCLKLQNLKTKNLNDKHLGIQKVFKDAQNLKIEEHVWRYRILKKQKYKI